MRRALYLSAYAVSLMLLAGCATAPDSGARREERQYVTGSNVPKRDGGPSEVRGVSRDELDRGDFQNKGLQQGYSRNPQ